MTIIEDFTFIEMILTTKKKVNFCHLLRAKKYKKLSIMIKLLKMFNYYGVMRVLRDAEYYHRKFNNESTKGLRSPQF